MGQDGQNTRFEGTAGENGTLKATDIITGGTDAYNTLAVSLSENWDGFDGVASEDGAISPNVTNVGRIAASLADENAQSVTFNAKNISDDAVRYDLDSKGSASTISLTDLGSSVSEIRITNVAASDTADQTTAIAFADDTPNDALTLVVDNVSPSVVNALPTQSETGESTASTASALAINMTGVKDLSVLAEANTTPQAEDASYTAEMSVGNSINLSQCKNLNSLNVKGSGDIALWGLDANHIDKFDASAATGNVTFGIDNLADQTVIGGSGRDMISFDNQPASVTKANWSGIEDVLMRQGGYIDATGVTGLQELWNLSNGQICTIENLEADNFWICGAPTWSEDTWQHVIVNGDIGNLNWTSAERGTGEQYFSTLESNAKGDFFLNVGGKDSLMENPGDGWHYSSYTLPELQGKITVDIANPTPGGAGFHITAPQAKSLEMNTVGTIFLGGDTDLAAVESVVLNLKSTGGPNATGLDIDRFSLSDSNGFVNNDHSGSSLQSVRQIDVSGGDCIVDLGNIGSKGNEGITFSVKDVQWLQVDSMTVSDDSDIVLDLGADLIAIGAMRPGSTTLGGLIGGFIDINTSNCSIQCMIENIESSKGINYIGGDQPLYQEYGNLGDITTVRRLGANSLSNFDLGGGNDELSIMLDDALNAGECATVDVTFGSGFDALYASTQAGLLRVNVKDYEELDELGVTPEQMSLDKQTVVRYFGQFGMKVSGDDVSLFELTVGINGTTTAVEYHSSVYLFNPYGDSAAPTGLTMTVLEGMTAADAEIIHLRW